MNFLLDTNVVSELVKPAPAPQVWQWVNTVADKQLFIAAITVGEIARGIEQLPASARKARYTHWFEEEILTRYADRILVLDTAVMLRWGALMAALTARGRVLPAFDSLLAATALAHDMRLVTRNTQHFAETGVQLVNPWALQS
jgi:predicted nucleic acid-binding protein